MKTIKTTFLLTFLLLEFSSFSQSGRKYTYDNAGNRILRESIVFTGIVINPNTSPPLEKSIENFEFNLYPNTTEGPITVDAQKEFMELENKTIHVYDMTGRLILKQLYSEENKKIDLSGQESGVYLVKLTASGDYQKQWNVLKR